MVLTPVIVTTNSPLGLDLPVQGLGLNALAHLWVRGVSVSIRGLEPRGYSSTLCGPTNLLFNQLGEKMATTKKPKVEVLVNGKPVEFSFRVLKNGGAVIGLKQKALDAKASKTTPKGSKVTKTTSKAKPSKSEPTIDGVRFEGETAIIRINGADVGTIPSPGGRKAWKRAINSNLWNAQGGAKDTTVWAHKVTYGDMPQ